MAFGNTPLLDNASRHPHMVANAIQARPTMLQDETPELVGEVARTLVRRGQRAQLIAACDGAGLDVTRREIVRAACRFNGPVH
jgi:hypothetical protein